MPKIPVIGGEEDDTFNAKIEQYKDVVRVSEKVLKKYGEIPNPTQNPVPGVEYDEAGFPQMPEDLTAIPSDDLGRLFQALEAFDAYFRTLATDADIRKTTAKEIRDLVKARLRKELRDVGCPESHIDDIIREDPRFISADVEYLQARALAQRMDDYKSIISRRYNLVSREITRRGNLKFADPDRRFQSDGSAKGSRIGRGGARFS